MSDRQVKFVLAVDAAQVVAGAKAAAKALGDVENAAEKAGRKSGRAGDDSARGAKKAEAATKEQARASDKAGESAEKSGKAGKAAGEATAEGAKKATASLAEQKAAAEKVSNGLMALGAGSLAVAAGAAKAAMDWESAFAGVRKTVDGSAEEMRELEGQLRSIAKTTPAAHREIAAVAEAAGQLGVRRGDIAAFTKVMIDLGETTNLTAEEAAMSLRQFMNIMGTAPSRVSHLGSALVALGNNSATTEKDILAMGQRLAGVGAQLRVSEPRVLALAAAMASVGIEAEAGGTAMSLTMKQIDGMVRKAGSDLDTLAQVAGMSSQQFAKAWRDDAAGAMDAFLRGLGKMSAQGKNVTRLLDDFEFKGIRQSDTLLRLAGATREAGAEVDVLSDALRISSEEYERNTALAEEAQKRYGTTASQAKIAWNALNEAAIEIGNSLLPMISSMAQAVADVALAFANLPASVKGIGGPLLVAVGTLGLAVGGAMKLTTWLSSAKTAAAALGTTMKGVSIAGGLAGVALLGIGAIVSDMAERKARAQRVEDNFAAALAETNGQLRDQSGLIHQAVRDAAVKQLADEGLLATAKQLGIGLNEVVDAILEQGDAYDTLSAKLQTMREAETSGSFFADAQNEELEAINRLIGGLELYRNELGDAAEKQRLIAEATGESTRAAGENSNAIAGNAAIQSELEEAVKEAAKAFDEYTKALYDHTDAAHALENALLGWHDALDKGEEAAEKYAQLVKEGDKSVRGMSDALDENTEIGRANTKAILDMAQAGQAHVTELIRSGASAEEAAAAHDAYRADLARVMKQMGLNADEAEALADKYLGLPPSVETIVRLRSEQAWAAVNEWEGRLGRIPDEVRTEIAAAANKGDLSEVERLLANAARRRTAVIDVLTRGVPSTPIMGRVVAQAEGGVVDYYAGGGLRERHVAQIAPAGSWRIWAEPETGGEAYIPLANDWRRPRARAVLAETAARIGMTAYRAGGVNAPVTHAPMSHASSTQVMHVTVQIPEVAAASGAGSAEWLSDFAARARRYGWEV